MKVVKGSCPAIMSGVFDPEAERRKLLAMIHIAKKDMGWSDSFYRSLLENCFGVATSAALTTLQLESFLAAVRTRDGSQAETG